VNSPQAPQWRPPPPPPRNGQRPSQPSRPADRERTRRIVGIVLYSLSVLTGLGLLLALFLLPPIFDDDYVRMQAMAIGAACALVPLTLYIALPRLVDRYDPEPWWCLLLAFGWGAFAACGFAAAINTGFDEILAALVGKETSEALTACVCAPVVEELWKGLGVFGTFYFLRREFDGVVDGVIYATFCALGFATVENVTYYARAGLSTQDTALVGTFIMRGVLSPWCHPLFTSMTGLGFGIARETERRWLRWMAPIFGYCGAVFLHSTWNTASTLSGMLMLLMLPLWFLFVFGFFCLLIWLVARKGRIIRDHLKDEVMMGFLTQGELLLVSSPVGRLRAGWGHGALGKEFVGAASRLALAKWHTGRAMRGKRMTVSADWIVPMRQNLAQLRTRIQQTSRKPFAPNPPMLQRPYDPRMPYGQPGQPGPQGPGQPPPYPGPPPPGTWRQ
jgi:RsiW-degrading membrane proteinase PrsW (M82 family)